jgi:tRNA(Ile2)-agmatinylcytidine synthase
MTWVGVDDTDSPRGGCTTFALTEVIRSAARAGFDLIGDPRLVRLNPNIPFKTRGNAALAARFGHGLGPARRVGTGPDGPVRAYARGAPLDATEDDALAELAWSAVLGAARRGEPGSDPAVVVAPHRLPSRLYWSAVQRLVAVEPVAELLRDRGARTRSEGSGRGLVGAAAAIAWPGVRATWELLAYRRTERLGRPRRLAIEKLRGIEARYPELFLCSDPATRRVLIAPHTACPILFGLRGTRAERLWEAARELPAEPIERWIVYRTNQGTGDHLSRRAMASLRPYDAAVLEGQLTDGPTALRGGHVRFELRERTGATVECWAFEPTKTLPRIAQRLRPGDRLRVWGGRADDARFRLEGLDLIATVPRARDGPNPRCPRCGRRLGSAGRGRGFRCPTDGFRAPPEARGRGTPEPPPALGRYHPTPSARRHLHPRGPEHDRPDPSEGRWWRRAPREDLLPPGG